MKQQTKPDGVTCELLSLARTADEAFRAQKAAEAAWSKQAKRRSPQEWRDSIDAIDDKIVRIQVACVVWWDYFGSRPASDPWPHLDGYKSAWRNDQNADSKKVRKALMQIGYPERIAERRSKVEAINDAD